MCARKREMYNNASEEKNKTGGKAVYDSNKIREANQSVGPFFVEKGGMLNEKPILKDMACFSDRGRLIKKSIPNFSYILPPLLCVFLYL